jgi:hypothetical protein
MADPVTLVILVAAGEAASPSATAMAQGARDAFAGTAAEVREARGIPTDNDAAALEDEAHPDAVAEVLWRDADHRHATVRVHLRRSARWIERSFSFGASDPAAERGRTLGFAVAAILPAAASPATAPAGAIAPPSATATAGVPTPAGTAASTPGTAPAPPPAASPAGLPAPAPAPAPSPPPAPATPPASEPAPASAPAPSLAIASATSSASPGETTEAAHDAARSPRIGIDLLGAAAFGIGGTAGTEGGGGGIEWFMHPRLSLRIGALARAGTIDLAEARSTTVVSSAGIVLHPWQATRTDPFAVSMRVDYILVRQSATHFDSDDPSPVALARWISGVDTFVDAQVLLSSQIAAVAGIGLEDVWSPTYIYVRDQRVAILPALRAVAEAGFQLRF